MTKCQLERKEKAKIRKKDNKGAVKDHVESEAVGDMGWEEKEVWRKSEDLVKSWKKKQRGMRLVEVKEEVKNCEKMGRREKGWPKHLAGWTRVVLRGLSPEIRTCVSVTAGGRFWHKEYAFP